ncbi:MAG: hypothetical protein HWN65_03720 [Candidatus Helarchaeota archaeon]|nr:hypothetical protein [Candidatus Helarchaeota archaeon]
MSFKYYADLSSMLYEIGKGLVPIAVKFSKKDQDFTGLKQLANLNSPLHALPKAETADGTEVGGVPIGGSSSKSIKIYTK